MFTGNIDFFNSLQSPDLWNTSVESSEETWEDAYDELHNDYAQRPTTWHPQTIKEFFLKIFNDIPEEAKKWRVANSSIGANFSPIGHPLFLIARTGDIGALKSLDKYIADSAYGLLFNKENLIHVIITQIEKRLIDPNEETLETIKHVLSKKPELCKAFNHEKQTPESRLKKLFHGDSKAIFQVQIESGDYQKSKKPTLNLDTFTHERNNQQYEEILKFIHDFTITFNQNAPPPPPLS